MTVIKFGRPDLSDELAITLERLDEAEGGQRFFVGQLADIRKVRAAVRDVSPETLEMLDQDIAELESEERVAAAEIAYWKEILADLQNRAAHPQSKKG